MVKNQYSRWQGIAREVFGEGWRRLRIIIFGAVSFFGQAAAAIFGSIAPSNCVIRAQIFRTFTTSSQL